MFFRFFGQVHWNGKAMSKRSSDTGPDGEPDQISSPRSAGFSSKSQRMEGQGHVGSGVTKETLKNMLLEKEAKLQKLQKEKKQLLQTVRRQETKIGKLQEELSETKGRKHNSLDVVRVSDSVKETGKSGSWFTPAGSFHEKIPKTLLWLTKTEIGKGLMSCPKSNLLIYIVAHSLKNIFLGGQLH